MSNARNPVMRGRFAAVAPVLADGEIAPVRVSAAAITLVTVIGTVTIAEVTPSVYTSGGDARDGAIGAAGARLLREIKCFNTTAATRYLMLFDAVALPANGTAPFWTSTTILTATEVKEVWNSKLSFPTNGCYWAISTTRATLTVGGAADANVSALFE